MLRLLGLISILVAILLACSGDGGSDTNNGSSDDDGPCEDCVAALTITFADGREDFELSFTMDDFQGTLQCPSGMVESNIALAELTCDGAIARLETIFISWEGTLSLSTATEMWTEEIVAGEVNSSNCHTCNSGSVTIE